MKHGIFLVALLANLVALFCILSPWFPQWSGSAIVFLVLEGAFLILIGVPVLVHHLRKGLAFPDAIAATLRSVMDFMVGWV